MKGEYINFWKASACGLGFLCMYLAVYSVQNIQSLLLSQDGYGQLGFYSNAVAYLGQLFGSLLAVSLMEKLGDTKTMVVGSSCCIPYIVCMLIPAFKSVDMSNTNWYFSTTFVYVVLCILSTINGFGEGVA